MIEMRWNKYEVIIIIIILMPLLFSHPERPGDVREVLITLRCSGAARPLVTMATHKFCSRCTSDERIAKYFGPPRVRTLS